MVRPALNQSSKIQPTCKTAVTIYIIRLCLFVDDAQVGLRAELELVRGVTLSVGHLLCTSPCSWVSLLRDKSTRGNGQKASDSWLISPEKPNASETNRHSLESTCNLTYSLELSNDTFECET